MPTYPMRTRLPGAYSQQIGRIITRWAYLESRLRQVSCILLRINPPIARLMIRELRASDYITMLEDAMSVFHLSTSVNLKTLRSGLQTLESNRDKLAHGIWVKHDKTSTPVLQDLSAKHPAGPYQGQKARINPKAVALTIENLRAWATGIATASKLIQKIGREINAQLRASPCKCCGQRPPRRGIPLRNRNSARRLSPRLPSEA